MRVQPVVARSTRHWNETGCAPRHRCARVLPTVIYRQEVRPMNAVTTVGAPLQSTIGRPS